MSQDRPPEPESGFAKSLSNGSGKEQERPSRGACAAIGVFLLVGSIVGAFLFPPILVIGPILAICSLFVEGYRYIFVGYILALLIGGGLTYLLLIAICGAMGIPAYHE